MGGQLPAAQLETEIAQLTDALARRVQIGVATELLAHFRLRCWPSSSPLYLSRLGLLWRLPKSGQTRL